MPLQRGQKLKLSDLTNATQIQVGLAIKAPSGMTLDISCFGIDAQGKLSDDRYFIFYNQKNSPCGALCSLGAQQGDMEQFRIDLSKLPPSIHKLVFTVTIDGNGTMSAIQNGYLRLLENNNELNRFSFEGTDFSAEKAIIIGELYRKDIWRFAAVGQGFNGGLSALLAHFGGEESTSSHPTDTSQTSKIAAQSAELLSNVGKGLSKGISSLVTRLTEKTPPTAIESSSSARRVSLEKRVEKEAPQLVSLVKKVAVSLEKVGLQNHQAKVALCLDVSGSMSSLYRSGSIQSFAEKILALGCRFDDDGAIDIFLFADRACNAGVMGIDNLTTSIIQQKVDSHNVGGGTEYANAIQVIRNFYFPHGNSKKSIISSDIPVYVMFITDGDTCDESSSEKQIQCSSYEPIFWQFMAIGSGNFSFLKKLDTLSGRCIDNANFFNVSTPEKIADDKLYDLLMKEYPSWLELAKSKGILK